MDLLTLSKTAAIIFAGFSTALAALLYMSARRGRRAASAPTLLANAEPPEIVFLFDGETLVDASEAARQLLEMTAQRGSDLVRLVNFLAPRFPEFHDLVMESGELEALDMVSSDGLSFLHIGIGGGRMRLTLEDCSPAAAEPQDRQAFYALSDELATYRAMDQGSVVPVWRQTAEGRITWANAAYHALADKMAEAGRPSGCLTKLFDLTVESVIGSNAPQRLQLLTPDGAETHWYDCQTVALGSDYLITALPADSIVTAERGLRDFIQTLTQTFAHLSVGLAIFDRRRMLTLFNPALTDLLALSPEFLISRPTLSQFLDQLREKRMIPEPKDYKAWRRQMSELEAAAADGSYRQTWVLADGRTFEVTGRPHPDGAVAFLFEDISAEISLTRRFRAELETGQAVLDSLDEAIAVFSPAGHLTMSNRVYADLWDCDPSTTLKDATMLEASRRWQKLCNPTPVWGDARDFAATIGERSDWSAEVHLRDGRRLFCRFEALPGGSTLVAFSEAQGIAYAPPREALEPVTA